MTEPPRHLSTNTLKKKKRDLFIFREQSRVSKQGEEQREKVRESLKQISCGG